MNGRADRFRVLVTAGWYPTEESPFSGVFIREQAEALAESCDVAVIFVEIGERLSVPKLHQEGSLRVARASLPRARLRNRRLAGYLNLATMTVGYGLAVLWSYALLRRRWGRPDVVHGHVLYPGGYSAWLIHKVARIPYVVTEHSSELLPAIGGESLWGYGRLIQSLVRRAAQAARQLIAVSTYLAGAIVTRGLATNVAVVPNVVRRCVDAEVPRKAAYRRAIHVSLMVDRAKNVSGLLRAVKILARRRSDFRLTLVGDGPDRCFLEGYAHELELVPDVVQFVGVQSQETVMRLVAESDFMVVSSRYETFSVAAAEALMCGRPVLSTRCGGPEDYIAPEVGLLVPTDDDAALAEGLDFMIDHCRQFDPEAIRAYAEGRFSSREVSSRLREVYAAALQPVTTASGEGAG